MEKIFSKVNQYLLLHIIHKKKDFTNLRYDFSTEDQPLQVSSLFFQEGKEVSPHKHLECKKIGKITQEAIIVISGLLEATYYDLDDSIIKKIILKEGDCAVTFVGGHSFKALTENTKLYEIKNGPYQDRNKDKTEINNV